LRGGAGNDVLVGGNGDDILRAGRGHNLLIGGDGADKLVDWRGQSIMISGTTSFDNDQSALFAIMSEWTSDKSMGTRMADLSGTGHGSSFDHRLNGNYFLQTTGTNPTVRKDAFANRLYASLDNDWLFAGPNDRVHTHHGEHEDD